MAAGRAKNIRSILAKPDLKLDPIFGALRRHLVVAPPTVRRWCFNQNSLKPKKHLFRQTSPTSSSPHPASPFAAKERRWRARPLPGLPGTRYRRPQPSSSRPLPQPMSVTSCSASRKEKDSKETRIGGQQKSVGGSCPPTPLFQAVPYSNAYDQHLAVAPNDRDQNGLPW